MRIYNIIFFVACSVVTSFGQQTMGLFQNDSTAFNGYTLIAPFNSQETYLIDNCGFVVNEWNNSTYQAGAWGYLLEDGSIMRTCRVQGDFMTGGSGGRLEQYDWDDNLIWSYDIADSTQQQHHDIEILPNGNILVLSFDFRTNAEAIAAGRDPNLLQSDLWSEKIIELQPVGTDSATIVWEWYLWDHLIQKIDANHANFGNISMHPELVDLNYLGVGGAGKDWIHANSIDYNEDLDQIVISARNYHEIWVIDHSTTTTEAAGHTGGNSGKGGDILYRWGNPKTYSKDETVGQELWGQHDAHWIPNGYRDGGKIMVYNNGLGYDSLESRVQIIAPPVDQNGNYFFQQDSAYLPKAVDWSYTTPNYSDFISGAQRLENGNTLICDGPLGIVMELDTLDKVVWHYVSPTGLNGIINTQGTYPSNNSLFRAYKYSPFYPAFDGRTLTPIAPIELNPLPSNCAIYFPVDTEPQWQTLDIRLIENPVTDVLRIENTFNHTIDLKVVDIMGRVVLSDYTSNTLLSYDTYNWAKGTYFIIAIDEQNNTLYRQQFIKL